MTLQPDDRDQSVQYPSTEIIFIVKQKFDAEFIKRVTFFYYFLTGKSHTV